MFDDGQRSRTGITNWRRRSPARRQLLCPKKVEQSNASRLSKSTRRASKAIPSGVQFMQQPRSSRSVNARNRDRFASNSRFASCFARHAQGRRHEGNYPVELYSLDLDHHSASPCAQIATPPPGAAAATAGETQQLQRLHQLFPDRHQERAADYTAVANRPR